MKLLAVALSVVFFVLTVMYWTGHGPFTNPGTNHFKHGVATLVLAALALTWWRFLSNADAPRTAGRAR